MPATLTKKPYTYEETKFDMPKVAQSATVLWFPDRHLPECYTAFVSKVDDRSVDIAIIVPEQVTMHIKTAVRHRNDPDGEIIDRSRNGCWDFPQESQDKLLVDLAKALKGLSERVEKLEKR